MKKLTAFTFFIFSTCYVQAQTGEGWFSLDGSDIDSNVRIIKDSICNECVYDSIGNPIPTLYHWCYYNYGEPPPEYYEIVQAFFKNDKIDTVRDWKVEFLNGSAICGDTFIGWWKIKETNLNKSHNYLPVYYEDLSLSIGDGYHLDITTPKEEMQRRDSIIEKEFK